MKGEAVGFKGYALALVVSVLMVSITAFAGEWSRLLKVMLALLQ